MLKLAATSALALLLAVSAGSAEALELPGPLVQTAWLAANLKNRQLVILDVRSDPQNFNNEPPPNTKPEPRAPLTGHIPGARLWEFKLVRENRVIGNVLIDKMVPAKRNFEATMRGLGVRNDSVVVVVANANDNASVAMGTRAYWTLKYFGHEQVALLDGGTGKWVAEKRPVSYSATRIEKSAYAAGERRQLLATSAEVEAALADQGEQLVDGRTADFYVGQSITNDARARGHIPGAKMLAHVELMNEKSRTFKPSDELRNLAQSHGIDVAKPAIIYSDTGHLGSVPWFVLSELLGNTGARLYDGSMHEWTRNSARAVSKKWETDMTYEENKNLVRRYYEEVVNTGAIDAVGEFVSPDYVEVHDNKRHAVGIEGAKEHIRGVRQTYPDLHLTVEQQIAEGAWVVSRVTMRGTHRGEWQGIKPTGKPIEVSAVNIDRVAGGLIVEHGGAANLLGPLLEIGAIQVVAGQKE